jgi:hypothetical protein
MFHVGLQDMSSGIRAQGAMLPHALLRPLPMGLVPAVVSPRMSSMLDHLLIHQTFIAILPLPLVLLGALAADRIRSTSRRACGHGG